MIEMTLLQSYSLNFVLQFLEEAGIAMEKNSHKNRAKPSSWNDEYLLNEYYSNPSMFEKSYDEEGKRQKQVPFSVEWQMYNA